MQLHEEYFKAGKIASEVRKFVKQKVRVGVSLLEIARQVEEETIKRNGMPAFPCNVCMNSVAAHYTPSFRDSSVVKEGDLVKVDFGVHVDGYLVDTAVSFSFNPSYDLMVEAAEYVLSEAIRSFRKGTRAGEIGRVIASAAQRRGYRTITNLSGHMVEPFKIHAGYSIPNIWVPRTQEIRVGDVYAVEPFLTTLDAAGFVEEGRIQNIFSITARRKTGEENLDRLIEKAWARSRSLPFATRFISADDYRETEAALERMVDLKILRSYPILVEATGRPVAQAEHTLVLIDDGVVVLTE